MQYMIKHVEESYPELFSFITEITTDHNDICRKIKDLMTYHTPLAIEEPSFQKIITDKIAGECPNLNVTVKTGQIGDNTYISSHVFKAIFDTVESNELEIALSYKPIDKIRTKLLFRDQLVLVQGDNLTIKRFGQALNELILDKNVKKRVRQHAELNERLMTDERIHRLHDHIQYLHESIHGGQPLGRYPTCDLCRLQDINP